MTSPTITRNMSGGKHRPRHRKTRKAHKTHKAHKARKTRKASKWNLFVKKIYHEMKRNNKNATFGEALKEASERKGEM